MIVHILPDQYATMMRHNRAISSKSWQPPGHTSSEPGRQRSTTSWPPGRLREARALLPYTDVIFSSSLTPLQICYAFPLYLLVIQASISPVTFIGQFINLIRQMSCPWAQKDSAGLNLISCGGGYRRRCNDIERPPSLLVGLEREKFRNLAQSKSSSFGVA